MSFNNDYTLGKCQLMLHQELLPTHVTRCWQAHRLQTILEMEVVPELLLGQICSVQVVGQGFKTNFVPDFLVQLDVLQPARPVRTLPDCC